MDVDAPPLPACLLASPPRSALTSFATEILPAPPVPAAPQTRELQRLASSRESSPVARSILPLNDPSSSTGRRVEPHANGVPNGRATRSDAVRDGRTRTAIKLSVPALARRSGRSASPSVQQPSTPPPITAVPPTRKAALPRSHLATSSAPPSSSSPPPPMQAKAKARASSPLHGEPNHEWCDACGGEGRVVMCDGCPNSFHPACLEPPLDVGELSDEAWFCRTCQNERNPPPRPGKGMFDGLLHHVQVENPKSFRLPEEIRTFFQGVETAPNGSYLASIDTKPPKFDRSGIVIERDPYPLRDRHGASVHCYRCGGSAAPPTAARGEVPRRASVAATTAMGTTGWRKMASCDYCSLHWHLDCVTPPLSQVPPNTRKWMCPNHAEHAMRKPRIPRTKTTTIEVKDRGRRNNGLVDVVSEDKAEIDLNDIPLEEIVMDSRRFRVPEKVIMLDFWDKLAQRRPSERPRLPPPSAAPQAPLFDDALAIAAIDGLLNLRSLAPQLALPPDVAMASVPQSSPSPSDTQFPPPAPPDDASLCKLDHRTLEPIPIVQEHSSLKIRLHTSSAAKDAARRMSTSPTKPSDPLSSAPPLPLSTLPTRTLPLRRSRSARLSASPFEEPPAPAAPAAPPPGSPVGSSGSSPLSSAPSLDSPEATTLPLPALPNGSAPPAANLSPEEIQQLRAVRELIRAKGEQALLDFLRS